MHPVMHVPRAMAFLHLRQFLFLFLGQKALHLVMRILHRLSDAVARLASDLLQLGGHFFDDRRNLLLLVRGQVQLLAQMFFHAHRSEARLVKLDEDMARVRGKKEPAHSSRKKSDKKNYDQLPGKGSVHFVNSAWIAESAIANSLVETSPASIPC